MPMARKVTPSISPSAAPGPLLSNTLTDRRCHRPSGACVEFGLHFGARAVPFILKHGLEAPLRIVAGIAALVAVIAGRAEAQSQWREYAYPDQQFAAAFPAPPEVTRVPFEDADGRRVTEVVYHLQQDSERFQVAVFDLLRSGINEPTAIARADESLREKGEVKIDIVAKVQGHWGHFLSSA